jgi:hypothetical protein
MLSLIFTPFKSLLEPSRSSGRLQNVTKSPARNAAATAIRAESVIVGEEQQYKKDYGYGGKHEPKIAGTCYTKP